MKKTFVLLLLFTLLASSVWWGSRAFFRMRHQLVTLDVRNAPLAEVLQSIARQTGTRIRSEHALNAHITLHIKDKPLAAVLDRVAEQAGAHWSTLYAVYDSPQAINALDAALRSDGKLEPAGWTKIAPEMPTPNEPGDEQPSPVLQRNGGEPQAPMPGRKRMMMVRNGPNGPVIFAGGPKGEVEMWSPEELVIESSLKSRLGSENSPSATAQAASEASQKVKGKWTTYFAFRKSNLGIGFGPMPHGQPGLDPMKHDPNDRFARLTPEQRVQRARDHLQFNDR